MFAVASMGALIGAHVPSALAQNVSASQVSPRQDEGNTTGTVISSTRNTMVIRMDDGTYRLFALDTATVRPARIAVGSQVQVLSSPGDDAGYRMAIRITVVAAAPAGSTVSPQDSTVPTAVRNTEREIERLTRRYRVGVRAGVTLDPELVSIGVQTQFGPFFSPNLSFRPGVEFSYGEVTALFALNPEFIYRLPVTSRQGRWSAYAGSGLGFNFIHQNFDITTGEGKRIDFGEFHSATSLNILGGLQYRSGMFLELRSSVYARPAPSLRLTVGYNF